MANFSKGLSKFVAWPITKAATFDTAATLGTKIPIPNSAVGFSLSAETDEYEFYADNENQFNEIATKKLTGTMEIGALPETFLINVLGYTKDANGVLSGSIANQPKNIQLAFEVAGSDKNVRVKYLNVALSYPEQNYATAGESTEIQTTTINITATNDKKEVKTVKMMADPGTAGSVGAKAAWGSFQ